MKEEGEEVQGFVLPDHADIPSDNIHNLEPLIPNRTCVLALECWNYKQKLNKRIMKNKELNQEIFRLKFALKHSLETVQNLKEDNKNLNNLLQLKTNQCNEIEGKYLKLQSNTTLQKNIINNNKIVINNVQELYHKLQIESNEMKLSK